MLINRLEMSGIATTIPTSGATTLTRASHITGPPSTCTTAGTACTTTGVGVITNYSEATQL